MSEPTDVLPGTAPEPEAAGGASRRRRATGLAGMLLPELQSLAGSMHITGTARMRKGELIAAIQLAQGAGGSAAGSAGSAGSAKATRTTRTSLTRPENAPATRPLRPEGESESALAKDAVRPMSERKLASKDEKPAEVDKAKSELDKLFGK